MGVSVNRHSRGNALTLFIVNTYIVYPKDNKTPDKVIILLTDILGIYTNTQLLADDFANKGYLIVMPDLFQGGQLSATSMHSSNIDLSSWLPKHQVAQIDPIMEKTIKYVRETLDMNRVGAVGYCIGAKVGLPPSFMTKLYRSL